MQYFLRDAHAKNPLPGLTFTWLKNFAWESRKNQHNGKFTNGYSQKRMHAKLILKNLTKILKMDAQ